EIGDPRRAGELDDLEPGERVRDVHLPGSGRVADRGHGARLACEQVEDPPERGARVRRERRRGAAQSATRGATTTQRSGSEPSLNVSIPERSLSRWWTIRRSVALIGSSSISLPLSSARSAARSAWRSTDSRRCSLYPAASTMTRLRSRTPAHPARRHDTCPPPPAWPR